MNNLKTDVMKLKVGKTAEVVEITHSNYPMLYENGAWGTTEFEFPNGNCSVIIGNTVGTSSTWHVPNGNYRRVGKLTVKALKHG